jgi:hypothetical protein
LRRFCSASMGFHSPRRDDRPVFPWPPSGLVPAGPRLVSYRHVPSRPASVWACPGGAATGQLPGRTKSSSAEPSMVTPNWHVPRPKCSPLGVASPRFRILRWELRANVTPRNKSARVAASERAHGIEVSGLGRGNLNLLALVARQSGPRRDKPDGGPGSVWGWPW